MSGFMFHGRLLMMMLFTLLIKKRMYSPPPGLWAGTIPTYLVKCDRGDLVWILGLDISVSCVHLPVGHSFSELMAMLDGGDPKSHSRL